MSSSTILLTLLFLTVASFVVFIIFKFFIKNKSTKTVKRVSFLLFIIFSFLLLAYLPISFFSGMAANWSGGESSGWLSCNFFEAKDFGGISKIEADSQCEEQFMDGVKVALLFWFLLASIIFIILKIKKFKKNRVKQVGK